MATKNAKQTIVTPIDERETFVSVAKVISDADGVSMEEKLRTIFKIQQADTQIDHIHLLRGELPLEVQDLEDEVEGLKTRISNFQEEVKQIEAKRAHDRATVEASVALVEKYKAQSENVRNNREYESIQKEIEYQELDQQACAKRIAEGALLIEEK
ncbi:MAG: hypothetical protein HUJ91_02015, partial [Bacteroidales bacterium]|nr:hypothetical protein [Bacteroidales bacterium]